MCNQECFVDLQELSSPLKRNYLVIMVRPVKSCRGGKGWLKSLS